MVIQGPEIKVQAAAPEIQKCLFSRKIQT